MASKIATQSDAYSKGGTQPSGYVGNKGCTNAMAISCGCADPGYASNRLVPENLLAAAGIKVTYRIETSYYDAGVTFTDCNNKSQTISYNGTDRVTVTYTGPSTPANIAAPIISNAWYKVSSAGTQNVGTIVWTKMDYTSSTVTFRGIVDDQSGGIL